MTADHVKFRQSLLNLLSNASKFTENGTIYLRVTLTQSQHRHPGLIWLSRQESVSLPTRWQKLVQIVFTG